MSTRTPQRTRTAVATAVTRPTVLVAGRALFAGAMAAVLGLALLVTVCLVSWLVAAHTSSPVSGPLRTAVAIWAWLLHAGMSVQGTPVTLTPLGLLVVPAGLAFAAGRWLARGQEPPDLAAAARQTALFAVAFALVGVIVTIVATGPPAYASPLPVAWWSLVVGGLGGGAGLVGLDRRGRDLIESSIPPELRLAVRAGTAAAAVVLAAAAVLTAVCLAAAVPDAAEITDRLDAGWWGGLVVAVVAVAFVPSLVIWAGTVLIGPGFAVGTATEISPRVVEYRALPTFPPVAALPPEGVVPHAAWAVLLIPLAAGVLAGLLVARRAGDEEPSRVAALAAGSGLVAGLWWGGLAWASAGALGTNRLSVIGPAAGRVGITVALEVGLVAALTAWEANRRGLGHRSASRNDSAPG